MTHMPSRGQSPALAELSGGQGPAPVRSRGPRHTIAAGASSVYNVSATTSSGAPMPRKGITGHDEWVITEALASAFVALEQLPPKHQPRTHMEDIKKLLASGREAATVSLHLAQAKCRLNPDIDPLRIYEEYGISSDLYG